jgi:hypothetical protein
VQARLVQGADEHGIDAAGFDTEVGERFAPDSAQTAVNGDPVTVPAHVPPQDTTDREPLRR